MPSKPAKKYSPLGWQADNTFTGESPWLREYVAKLIRRAYRAGQRAKGKPIATGWVGEKPVYDELGRLCIDQEWTPDATLKVEIRRK